MAQERVLVVERQTVEKVDVFHGLNCNVDKYLESIFADGALRFMDREAAEQDPAFKQLIPYVIMTYDNKYWSYVRGKRAGESRLKGNRSIGIGGHINPVDLTEDAANTDFRRVYKAAVQREVEEEVNLQAAYTDRVMGLLNDDTNEVGQVHLGIVHLWQLDSDQLSKREQMITQTAFMTSDELQREWDSLETWSQLCLQGLREMEESGHQGHCVKKIFGI